MSSNDTNTDMIRERGRLARACLSDIVGRQQEQEFARVKESDSNPQFQSLEQTTDLYIIEGATIATKGGTIATKVANFAKGDSHFIEMPNIENLRSEPSSEKFTTLVISVLKGNCGTLPPSTFEEVKKSLNSRGYEMCAERIDVLTNPDNLLEDEKTLSLESAATFLSFISDEGFMSDLGNLGEPSISVFPEGTMSAEWDCEKNRSLLMEFHEDNNVSFAMIDGDIRLNARANKTEIVNILKKQRVGSWK